MLKKEDSPLSVAARQVSAINLQRAVESEEQKRNQELELQKEANSIASRASFIAFGALIVSIISIILSAAALMKK